MKGWTLKLVEEPGVKRIRQYQAEGYTWNGRHRRPYSTRSGPARTDRKSHREHGRPRLSASIVSKLRAVR